MSDVLERAARGFRPKVALILGSGLGGFVDEVAAVAEIPYADLPGFPRPTVGGHAGRLVLGHVGPTPVAVMQGRAHYYERGRANEMKGAIEALAGLGCEILLQSNAAGSLQLDMPPGSVMAISDHINFTGVNPLFNAGPGDGRFVAFTSLGTNLIIGDTNGQSDIFLRDRLTGITSRVSLTAGGTQATGGASTAPRLSADGHLVVFMSKARNLIPGLNPGRTGQIYVRLLGE